MIGLLFFFNTRETEAQPEILDMVVAQSHITPALCKVPGHQKFKLIQFQHNFKENIATISFVVASNKRIFQNLN